MTAEAQLHVELTVADALKAGGSTREVSKRTGLSTTTVQKRGHGRPTAAQVADR